MFLTFNTSSFLDVFPPVWGIVIIRVSVYQNILMNELKWKKNKKHKTPTD